MIRQDGRAEVIDLVGTCIVQHGDHLNRIRSESGMEHFFTHDGAYDGWGCAAPADGIEGVERDRRIEPPE